MGYIVIFKRLAGIPNVALLVPPMVPVINYTAYIPLPLYFLTSNILSYTLSLVFQLPKMHPRHRNVARKMGVFR